MKYALPCAGTLVKRGSVTQEVVDDLIQRISEGREIPENAEAVFKVANVMCRLFARNMDKTSIDDDVIRRYFLFEHDYVIDKRHQDVGDFDPEACRTCPGRVLQVKENTLLVKTPQHENEYRRDFVHNIKKGDFVVVHWDFAVEKIDRETVNKLLEIKHLSKDIV